MLFFIFFFASVPLYRFFFLLFLSFGAGRMFGDTENGMDICFVSGGGVQCFLSLMF